MYHSYQPIDFTQRVFRTTRGKDLAHISSPPPQAGGTRAETAQIDPNVWKSRWPTNQHRCEVARLRFIRGFAISAATLVTTATPGRG